MALDEPKGSDVTFTDRGVRYLIDKNLLEEVKPLKVDFTKSFRGSGFQLTSNLSSRSGEGCCGWKATDEKTRGITKRCQLVAFSRARFRIGMSRNIISYDLTAPERHPSSSVRSRSSFQPNPRFTAHRAPLFHRLPELVPGEPDSPLGAHAGGNTHPGLVGDGDLPDAYRSGAGDSDLAGGFPSLSTSVHKYGDAPRGSMRRIRQGAATEAYWASTVRERNAAGADAAALECHRIYELKY